MQEIGLGRNYCKRMVLVLCFLLVCFLEVFVQPFSSKNLGASDISIIQEEPWRDAHREISSIESAAKI